MINNTFTEVFSQEWIEKNIKDTTNELVILREIIPWEKITKQLSQFYSDMQGCYGKSLRIVVGVLILSKLRMLSDEKVVQQIKENRYYQYFCNVPDDELFFFMHPSSLCKIRQRFGEKGVKIIETNVFEKLRRAGIIDPKYALMDSSVLENNIVYPTDVKLVYKAFQKLECIAQNNNLSLWWDHEEIKTMWREFSLNKEKNPEFYLSYFSTVFKEALCILKCYVEVVGITPNITKSTEKLIEILMILDEQNDLKLKGEKHIANRIVSLDEEDARPIKKGKKHPKCEFGTTFQATFNRQGFMITIENFIGQPNDKILYPETLELFQKRMKQYPEISVTDLGYRSRDNFNASKDKVPTVFLGRSSDVSEDQREDCHKARSATEGFIAVAKHWRGMKRSLYKGFSGDRIWSLLCQTAHNMKKFVQLYQQEKLSEKSLVKLGLLG